MLKGDSYEMVARRSEPNSLRGYQKLLSTRLKAWGVELPDKQQGWLCLLTDEECSQRVSPKPAAKPLPPQCSNWLFLISEKSDYGQMCSCALTLLNN